MTTITDTFKLNNDLLMPKVGFGTWQTRPGKETYDAVSNALTAGYRFIDTAKAYQNEASVGEALHDANLAREAIFVQTKLPAETKSYEGTLADFESSLKALQLDYVDSYIIHAPWPWREMGANYDAENREVWRAMQDIYQSGRAKSVGVSNFNSHDLENLLNWDGLTVKPAVDQIQYYVGHTQASIVTTAEAAGIVVQAYSPLATGGLLADPTLERLADKYQVTLPQLALRFIIQNGVAPLPKARAMAHVEANTKLDFEINAEDMAYLNKLTDKNGWHPVGD
ncbi:putative oxidoreductase YtbE [Lactobacillus brevis KB290] [Lactiplantibacillus mudanjiangensis]|uniref:aldo/keto reductase family protein n=1 Tax=Lactiplantibacillus mudanjiangensis TaxID=1296538 RepID=UPI0010147495|nr:aldo/keto reductase [Lactiplantibacillus mudanjiangensis]VDG31152.1 putative oxidoreductase YtbE [Lactobacillus brevis KB290] [Lactiplantibacillus mudanjiangensis]